MRHHIQFIEVTKSPLRSWVCMSFISGLVCICHTDVWREIIRHVRAQISQSTLLLYSPKVGQWLELGVQAELTWHASLANESLDFPPWPGVWWKRALYFSPSALPVNVMFTQCGGHIMCALGKHSKISFAVFQHVNLTVVAWGPTHISNRLGGEVSTAHLV